MPGPDLPFHACDSHVHVFGDPVAFPAMPGAAYAPPPRTLADLRALHRAHGISRAVLVQPMIYGADHRVLIDALNGRPEYRGVAIINDNVSDDELARLHAAGVRGARFGLGSNRQGPFDRAAFERALERIQKLGWHIKLGVFNDDLTTHAPWLRKLTLPIVLDHLAGMDPTTTSVNDPRAKLVVELLEQPNWWIMLSNADRRSPGDAPWNDMLPFAQAFARAAPERTIWSSDWPHVLYQKPQTPAFSDLIGFLHRAVEDSAIEAALVHNPARLYGFRT